MPLEDLICCDNGNGNSSKQITVYMIITEDVDYLIAAWGIHSPKAYYGTQINFLRAAMFTMSTARFAM